MASGSTMKYYRSVSLVMSALLLSGGMAACHSSYEPYAKYELSPSSQEPDRLSARFFGVSTILFDDGKTAIMTDGFFSRPPFAQVAFGNIWPDEQRITDALMRGEVNNLSALLVAHSHYDHAMDSARVAKLKG